MTGNKWTKILLTYNVDSENGPKDNLVEVCDIHASTWSPELALKDLNCTQESPETCPPTTLCCLNKCYGAINDEENTFTLPSFHCPGQL